MSEQRALDELQETFRISATQARILLLLMHGTPCEQVPRCLGMSGCEVVRHLRPVVDALEAECPMLAAAIAIERLRVIGGRSGE